MNWRRLLISLVVLCGAAMSLVGVTNLAQAAPRVATLSPLQEQAKVVLGETSIDGPAIASMGNGTVLAWTGTDTIHHLNIMTSTDGLYYSNKHILPETSLWRPAVLFITSGRALPYGTIVVAWTGTDRAHTLNLELISTPAFKVTKKITYWGETSFTAPALAAINRDVNSDIYLAWSGTDGAHTLNVIHYSTVPGTSQKQTLWGWSSISRPNLSTDQSSGNAGLILAWTGVDNHIYFAKSTDTVHWIMPSSSPLALKSAWAPSLIAFYATSMPTHWLAWTGSGTTGTRLLSVQYAQHYPSWSDTGSSATMQETAISSPELANIGVNGQVLLAWTGTDVLHHLNVAVIGFSA
jgi:hypothetical protein